ncbi:hypothetical protein [Pontibacter cellulosilyticus]|uniref:Uncharacterized protein n=1 Tax=Pontibacter cellulosilyticus TaxID=1720253 RepID=A0A923N6K0_9BACT|nr:hypothetical protein [Pontibacter cellulosilyticus]MBC5992729.1 hypothetical protein [Pontibacter cellulosilyticus]
MHHEENEHRRHHYREMRHRRDRDMHHPHRQEHFQDFTSRWGEPEPLIHLNHQSRHAQDMGRLEDQPHYRQQREEWHDPRHNQYEQRHQEPIWRQRDVHFDKSNQRVEDRWFDDDSPMMPPPQNPEHWEHRPHPRNRYWDENEY